MYIQKGHNWSPSCLSQNKSQQTKRYAVIWLKGSPKIHEMKESFEIEKRWWFWVVSNNPSKVNNFVLVGFWQDDPVLHRHSSLSLTSRLKINSRANCDEIPWAMGGLASLWLPLKTTHVLTARFRYTWNKVNLSETLTKFRSPMRALSAGTNLGAEIYTRHSMPSSWMQAQVWAKKNSRKYLP